jgi:hypothetical protein
VLVAWLLFPVVLGLLGAGWGLLVRRLLWPELTGSLVIPLGVAALIVLGGLTTSASKLAPVTVPLAVLGALAGVVLHARDRGLRLAIAVDGWAALLAVGLIAVYGAPVLLSGHATFAGYLKLDDTATWLSIVDRVLGHGRSLSGLPASTYALNLHAYLTTMGYPIGSFLPLAIGRALTGADAAWVFQPSLACCGALVGLALDGLLEPVITRRRARALVVFLAAQSALLYGYAQWGGIKELTGAATIALLAAVVARALSAPPSVRVAAVVGLAGAAVAVALGAGAVAWVAPAYLAVGAAWLWRARADGRVSAAGRPLAVLAGATAVLMLPVWLTLSEFLHGSSELFSSLSANTATGESGLVSLLHPLTVLQLGGPWPVGDFRRNAPAGLTAPLLVVVAVGLGLAAASPRLRNRPALLAYPAIALAGLAIVALGGANPWVLAKALAMAAPAIPAVALAGGVLVWERSRWLSAGVVAVIGAGLLWSNVLAQQQVTLAPRDRLAELAHIDPLLRGHGPTLVNEYEVYGDRHFLRDGAPVEPAEYRPYTVPLADGQLLTKVGWSDLDAFAAGTVIAYPSLVTRNSPVTSRPPSFYSVRWAGRYYTLWQRPLHPTQTLMAHVPLGDSNTLPFCGHSTTEYRPLCPVEPVAVPACSLVRSLARRAAAAGARIVAYARPAPVVVRADQASWPAGWDHDPAARTLVPLGPGVWRAEIRLTAGRYALWLGGSFARGFAVSVDGRPVGRVEDQLSNLGQFVPVRALRLGAGAHTVALRYPSAGLTSGSGATGQDLLSAVVLDPLDSARGLLDVAPAQAAILCGRPLDWIEVVAGRAP